MKRTSYTLKIQRNINNELKRSGRGGVYKTEGEKRGRLTGLGKVSLVISPGSKEKKKRGCGKRQAKSAHKNFTDKSMKKTHQCNRGGFQ